MIFNHIPTFSMALGHAQTNLSYMNIAPFPLGQNCRRRKPLEGVTPRKLGGDVQPASQNPYDLTKHSKPSL